MLLTLITSVLICHFPCPHLSPPPLSFVSLPSSFDHLCHSHLSPTTLICPFQPSFAPPNRPHLSFPPPSLSPFLSHFHPSNRLVPVKTPQNRGCHIAKSSHKEENWDFLRRFPHFFDTTPQKLRIFAVQFRKRENENEFQ